MECLVRNATSKLPDQQHKRANVNHVLSGRGPFCQVLSPICAGAALAPGLLVLRLLVQIWLHAFTRLCSWPVSLLTKFPFPSIAWRGCGEREREKKKPPIESLVVRVYSQAWRPRYIDVPRSRWTNLQSGFYQIIDICICCRFHLGESDVHVY